MVLLIQVHFIKHKNCKMKSLFAVLFLALVISYGCNKNNADLAPNAEEFFTLELDGDKIVFQIPADTVAGVRIGDFLEFFIQSPSTGNSAQTFFSSPRVPGFYSARFYFYVDSVLFISDNNFKTQVSYYGNTGDFIRGYYNGMVHDSIGNAYNAKGQYQVRLNW